MNREQFRQMERSIEKRLAQAERSQHHPGQIIILALLLGLLIIGPLAAACTMLVERYGFPTVVPVDDGSGNG